MERPDDVFDIAKSYVDAGSDMIGTNSFGGSCYKLGHYGLSDRSAQINEAAAGISRTAAGEGIWVIASVGPTGIMLVLEEVTEEEMYNAFMAQAMALERGGADAVCIETMSDIEEACIAIRAAKENTSLGVICTFTFDLTAHSGYRTMMGASPGAALDAAVKAGADIVGTNCGNGFARMIDIVTIMRETNNDIPILVHANAGLPQAVDGRDVYPETPEDMARLAPALARAGANIIGGCCGTTPAHIRAMKKALAR